VQSRDTASDSLILPAIACAEYVVSVGTGSSLITILTAVVFGGSSGFRTAGIAAIPLVFVFIASGFTLRAHQVIAQTAPVFWCAAHDRITPGKGENPPFAIQHFPASIGSVWSWAYMPHFWLWGSAITGTVFGVVFLGSMMWWRNLRPALWSATKAGIFSVAGVSCFVSLYITALIVVIWIGLWVVLWWPMYILALFPQVG
jgi:hypothetical protein